jgi:uncharacterized protein
VLGVPGYSRLGAFEGEVDTVTLYVGPSRQPEIVEDLLEVAPGRVIFNPGTESPQSEKDLREAGIETEGACTLVLLQTERF